MSGQLATPRPGHILWTSAFVIRKENTVHMSTFWAALWFSLRASSPKRVVDSTRGVSTLGFRSRRPPKNVVSGASQVTQTRFLSGLFAPSEKERGFRLRVTGSGRAGSGRAGSGQVASGRVESGRLGPNTVGPKALGGEGPRPGALKRALKGPGPGPGP